MESRSVEGKREAGEREGRGELEKKKREEKENDGIVLMYVCM